MNALESIINDIFSYLPPDQIDIITSDLSGADVDRKNALRMNLSHLNEVSAVNQYLLEELGSLGIKQIIKKIGIQYSPNEPLKILVKNWTSYRGLNSLTPRSRPYELALRLKETATQVSSDIQSFEAIEVAAPELKQLLRFISAYYLRDKHLNQTIDSESEFAKDLIKMSFTELAGSIETIGICLLEPYNPNSTKTISVLDEEGAELLWRLVRIWNKLYNRFADDDKTKDGLEYCNTLIELLDHWRGKQIKNTGIIPRGAIVVESNQNELGVLKVLCRDEFQEEVNVNGISSFMDIGTTVLLSPDLENKTIWGPELKPVFEGPEWSNTPVSSIESVNTKEIEVIDEKKQIFLSYSRQDIQMKDKIIIHLNALKHHGINCWNDDHIRLGEKWNEAIEIAIDQSQVFILMISKDFLSSDFIRVSELPEIKKRKNTLIIPVLLNDCSWDLIEFIEERQMIPKNAVPLSSINEHEHDKIFRGLVKRISDYYKND